MRAPSARRLPNSESAAVEKNNETANAASPPEMRRPRPGGDRGLQGEAAKEQSQRSATPIVAQGPERKWRRVVRALLAGSLNRWEATRPPVKDWVLPSTISELEKRGIVIDRKPETVVGAYGDVHCVRYWIAPQSRELARTLLGGVT